MVDKPIDTPNDAGNPPMIHPIHPAPATLLQQQRSSCYVKALS